MSNITKKYKLLKPLPDDFKCPVCLDAVYDAVETKCCGVLLCMSCFRELTSFKMACPQCRTSLLAAHANQFMRRKVRQLHIYCINRQWYNKDVLWSYPVSPNSHAHQLSLNDYNSCNWSGEINDLQSHLDNHCPHATVTCRYKCGVEMVRLQKDVHEAKVCCKRPFSCWFCDMKAIAEEIDDHAIKCDKRPIECPNKCSAELLQGELQLHLEQCPLQEISCEFEHVGCKEKVLRKDHNSHIECNTHKHLELLSSKFVVKLSEMKEMKQGLAGIKAESARKVEEIKKRAIDKRERLEQLRQEATVLKQNLQTASKSVHILSRLQLQSIDTICIVQTYTTSSSSAPFYIMGLCVSVEINYKTETMSLLLHSGNYDDDLLWPAEGVVTLVLMHPMKEEQNKKLIYSFFHTQRPTTSCNTVGTLLVKNLYEYLFIYLHQNARHQLSVENAQFD